jgi:alpha-D-xyloside xylohydrolase
MNVTKGMVQLASLVAASLAGVLPAQANQRADMTQLQPLEKWSQPAEGVWVCTIGNMDKELRYTDTAAAAPRLAALKSMPSAPFPFDEKRQMKYMQTSDHKIIVRIPTEPGERLYGFGLQFDGLNKSATVLTLNMDHWGMGGGRTHAPVPFYFSNKGYGVFFNTARFLKVYAQIGNRKDSAQLPPRVDRNPPADEKQPGHWMAVPPGDAVEAMMSAEGMEMVVFSGSSLLEIVCRYNLYCGGGALPPLWGLGFWHRVHAAFDAEQTRNEITLFDEKDYPLEVIGLEPGWMTKSYPCTFEWQKKRFPDPAAFCQDLLKKGIRLNLWENPYVSPASRIYERLYPLSGSHLVWLGIVPDYTLPAARRLLTEQHGQDHIRIGISGYKIDEVDGYDQWLWPDHATFPSGLPGETMRQAYGLLMQNMLYNDLFRARNVRTYGLVRASNGAACGYPFVIYSDSYSHSQYITGLSAASLCGILWTPEIRSARSGREWLNRMQTVCFSPLAQLNAWSDGTKPWQFPDVADPVREVIRLRMRLLPYFYTAFAEYHFKGIPPVRAMVLEEGFAGLSERVVEGKLDPEKNPYAMGKVVQANDQFMFGPSMMVAPFYEDYTLQRTVQVPPGNWYDFYTGRFVGNDKAITVTAQDTENRIPLYVKGGAVIPLLSGPVNNTSQAYNHPLELRLYGAESGTCTIYEDDGTSFNYERGQYRLRRMDVSKTADGKFSCAENVIEGAAPAMFGAVESVRAMTP